MPSAAHLQPDNEHRLHEEAYNRLMQLIEKVGLTKRGFAARLEDHGFSYSVASIGNWLHRGIPHKPGLLQALVQVLVESSSARCRCTADDALQFLAPARFAFADLPILAPLFSPDEFRAALFNHMPLFQDAPDDSSFPNHMPAYRTSFIGCAHTCSQVRQLLIDHHLVTLWGTGGCGKTRLAIQVAHEMQGSFRHGMCFVDLSAVRDPSLVLAHIAQALRIQEIGGATLAATLRDYLASRHGLLLLDNFEQVIDAAPLISDLLDAAPMLHILVTSREPLHLYGEQQYALPPLTLAAPDMLPSRWDQCREMLLQSEAVQLFIERARAAQFDFALTSDNAQAIAELCAGLEGLPLLIELVASRITMFTPQDMARHIHSRLDLASGTMRNLPPRQRSAVALIGWSYDLLSSDEQMLFARLAVFAGSFSLAAADAICTATNDLTLPVTIGLESLLNKSLLRHKERLSSEARFLLLEPVRAYASMVLHRSDRANEFMQHHATYYFALAEQAAEEMGGPQQACWLSRLEDEHDNLRVALQTLLEHGEADTAVQLCARLELFWYWCGHQREGRMWLERALEYDSLSDAARAKALDEAGGLAWMQGDYAQARELAERSLTLWRMLGNTVGIIEALNTLGLVAESLGDLDQAIVVHRQGLALRRELDNPRRMAIALGNLGDVELYYQPAALEQAIAHFKESLSIYQSLADQRGSADMLVSLADAALFQNDYERAAAQFRQSLILYGQIANANRNRILRCLERLPVALAMLGQPERGARLLGAVARLRGTLAIPRSPIYQSSYEYTIQLVRARCGDAAFSRATAESASYTLDQTIAEALDSTLSPVTLCRWRPDDIAHWPQDPPYATDNPAARAVLVSPLTNLSSPFHTVIPSWQATTPPDTWIELHVQALIGTRWTHAYRLAAWDTAATQSQRRSFESQRDADGYVDTETLRLATHAQAVQARIVLCSKRADTWPELHSLTLCLSARSREPLYGERRNLSSTPFQVAEPITLPTFSQYAYSHGAGWCSATAVAMVLGYWYQRTGNECLQPFLAPESIPNILVPLVEDVAYGSGNWSFNTASAASLGLESYVTQLLSLHQVARWVAAGVPVICSLAWEAGDLEHAPLARSDGHLLVVCGVGADGQLTVADPAGADASQIRRTYRGEQFTACWQRHSAGTVYLIYPPAWNIPVPYPGDPW